MDNDDDDDDDDDDEDKECIDHDDDGRPRNESDQISLCSNRAKSQNFTFYLHIFQRGDVTFSVAYLFDVIFLLLSLSTPHHHHLATLSCSLSPPNRIKQTINCSMLMLLSDEFYRRFRQGKHIF